MFLTTDDLRRDRLWMGLSTAELAERAGMSAARLSKLETGRVRVSSKDRRSLSQALSATLREKQSRQVSAGAA